MSKKTQYSINEINRDHWQKLWKMVTFPNLFQSWEYGEAKKVQNWTPIRLVISNANSDNIGLVQVLIKRFPFKSGVIRINRGPVFFTDIISKGIDKVDLKGIWVSIRQYFEKERLWLMFVAPEIPFSDQSLLAMKKASFFRLNRKVPFGSSRINLVKEEKEILQSLSKKWRYSLKQAQKKEVKVVELTDLYEKEKCLLVYEKFQQTKKFTGVPHSLIKSLILQSNKFMDVKFFCSFELDSNKMNGFVIFVFMQNVSIYLAGWSNESGRTNMVNYLLLWHALSESKDKAISWLDLGGISDNTPKGIAHFKKGLQGFHYKLVGEYLRFFRA